MKNEVRPIDANELVNSLKNRRLHILLENENDGAGVFDDIVDWIKYTPEIAYPPAHIDREEWKPCQRCGSKIWPEGGISVERLVTRIGTGEAVPLKIDLDFVFDLDKRTFDGLKEIFSQLCALTDILGDDYDLDRLRELVEADRDGRCVVLPAGGHTEKDGENALKSAMNTCFYHNNPVTRYIADAVAEKLTREADKAALKGDQNGKEV